MRRQPPACVGIVCLCASFGASHGPEPIFSVSFDDSLEEVSTDGQRPSVAGEPHFAPGKFGRALRVGALDQYLLYPVRSNIDPLKGTLSMWVKPVGFAPSRLPDADWDGLELFRVVVAGDEIKVAMTRSRFPDNQRCYLFIQTCPVQPDGFGGGGDRVRAWGKLTAHPGKVVVPWREDEFKHVAATWDFQAGRIEIFLGGKCLKATRDDTLRKRINPELPSHFQIGPYKGGLNKENKDAAARQLVLDEVKIFDRRLVAREIAALAGIERADAYDRNLLVKADALYETSTVVVEVEAGPLRAQTSGPLTLVVDLRRDGRSCGATRVPLARDHQTVEIKPAAWEAGEHTVEVAAISGDRSVARNVTELKIAPRPVWWDNRIGMEDVVQPPWTPVRVAGQCVSVWGRDYDLADTGLPSQVTTQGVKMLAAPVELRMGEERMRTARLRSRLASDTRAVYSVEGTLGAHEVSGTVEVMYDGVVECDYTLTPPAAATKIAGLRLDIPVHKELSEYLVRRAEAQGLIQQVTLPAHEDLLLPFNHSLWLGDGDHGLNWYADTEEGWTAPRERAVELNVLDDRVLLTLHILAPGPATPLRLRFGLLATPFRPLAKGWRRMRLGCNQRWWSQANYDLYDTAKCALFGKSPLDKNPSGQYYVPGRDRQWLDDTIKAAHDRGAKFVLYSSAHGLAEQANARVYPTYHTEWDMTPLKSYNTGARRFYLVCPRSRHVNYFIWNLDRMIKAGKLDAVYFDQAAPDFCKNALHGCGYQDGAARRQSLTIRAQREFYRRARQVFLNNGLEPMMIGHNSNQLIPACYTHLDAVLNGEQFTGNLVNDDYISLIDEPMLRTQWNAQLMGIPPIFLPEIMWQRLKREGWNSHELWEVQLPGPEATRATRGLMALLLPNDAIFYGGLMNLTIGQRVWEIWDTLDDADHISHRDAGITLTPAPPKIQCGLYLKPNAEALLAVGNLSEKRERVKVRMDPSTIALTGMEVVDIFDGRHCELAGQTVSMDVGGKDFRLVALRRPRHEDSAAESQKTVIGEQ